MNLNVTEKKKLIIKINCVLRLAATINNIL